MAQRLKTDIVIIGGGIAGLWTLNQLRNRGFQALLFENRALGSYQSMGSQGMIHGGIKYALGGSLSGSSEAIASMPDAWRACLKGEGAVDLSQCRVLSEDFFLWSSASLHSRISTFFASHMLRGRVKKMSPERYPAPLRDPAFRGQVYQLVDLVLDMPSLIQKLADNHREAIFQIDWGEALLERAGGRALLQLPGLTLDPDCLLLTAGAGNEALMEALGSSGVPMQRRPLQQVLFKHEYREDFFGHCTGLNPSPRLTVSSHRTRHDEPVWYLGGDLATENPDDTPDQLIDKARRELTELLPWINFGKTEWRTFTLDRAEPRQSSLLRPDEAFVGALDSVDNALVAWPTKLTLSPNLADAVERELAQRDLKPGPGVDLSVLSGLARPGIAPTVWDEAFA
ncbi:MAG: FAD-dependent oxidoreductase [Pseudomonadota bacterium]